MLRQEIVLQLSACFKYSNEKIWEKKLNKVDLRLESAEKNFVAKIASLENMFETKYEEVNRNLSEESMKLNNYM